MNSYIYKELTKEEVKKMEPKQTVIVEDFAEGTKPADKKRTVYLGNWKDRRHAFKVFQDNSKMKTTRKNGKTRSFRLLKLHRLFEELKTTGYNIKTVYMSVSLEAK